MKKKIFLCLAAFSLMLMIFTSLAMGGIYYRFYQNAVESALQGDAALMAPQLEEGGDPLAVLTSQQKALDPGLRISYIRADGTVLFDTDAQAESLENHADRQEILLAREQGQGEAIRHSDSLGVDTYYYAVALSNGDVLRVSQPLSRMSSLFSQTLPILALVLAAILVLAVLIARWLTDSLMSPILQASAHLDTALQGHGQSLADMDTYEELAPFLRKIDHLNLAMQQKIREIQDQRDTLNTLVDNMDEGFVLLSPTYELLIINPSARRLLKVPEGVSAVGESFLHINRDIRLQTAIRQAMNEPDGSRSVMLEHNQYYLNPVRNDDGQLQGVVMLVLDMGPAMRAEESRRDFAANVSHELKTPLTSIHGFAEMMANHMVPEKDADQIAQRILKESGRLIRLIEDIIRLSQIESQGTADTQELVALDQIARETCARLEPVAQEKQVLLETRLEPVMLPTGAAYIEELFYNLIDNAIKYNKTGGKVTVTLEKLPQKARIKVSDTGIGIESAHLDRIFERFYRVDKSRSKQTGGTGLGLSIVKHIVENLGGSIGVESTPGTGTTFTLELPLERSA